jgi:SAM-dependent methyltransferase
MWNERFSEEGYLFGTEPAEFLRREAGRLAPGSKVLCLADGEGRNSVYLAGLGHDVTAMDGAEAGIAKARRLAADRGVSLHHQLCDIGQWEWAPAAYDAVVGIFMQFAGPALRQAIHGGIARTLRPGGIVFLHGYGPDQLRHGTGGPKVLENLYTPELLAADFPGWSVLRSASYEADLAEGTRHVGRSALVDFIAVKPGG